MAVTLDILIERIDTLDEYLKMKSADVMVSHQDEIISLSNAQLMEGKNINDKIMQQGYSKGYTKRRMKQELQTKFVDLRFTGKYQDTKKLHKTDDGVDIKSDVDYEKYLRGNFPEHVGLTSKNSEIISEAVVNEIAQLARQYLLK
jgi:hypothetical protein